MTDRILDCLDGRRSKHELTSFERRLLDKIEEGLRSRMLDYQRTREPEGHTGPPSPPPSDGPFTSGEQSALAAFLERSARRHLRAG